MNTKFTHFSSINSSDISKFISPLVSNSCDLDAITSTVLKHCIGTLLPVLTMIVNLSLATGTMHSDLRVAVIRPILKKQTLSPGEFNSF